MSKYKKTILIVDDDTDLRQGLMLLFEDDEFDIEQAASGKAALAVIEKKTIDLLITDILMPEMDGIELTQKVKNIYPEFPVIFISGGGRQLYGESQYDYLSDGQKLTSTDYALKKPFDPQKLIDMVYQIFAGQG